MKNTNSKNFFYLLTSLVTVVGITLFIIRSSNIFEEYTSIDFFGVLNNTKAVSTKDYEVIKSQEEKFAIIYDQYDDLSIELKENTKVLLDYLKKEYIEIEKLDYLDLDEYSSVIVTF